MQRVFLSPKTPFLWLQNDSRLTIGDATKISARWEEEILERSLGILPGFALLADELHKSKQMKLL